MKNTPSTHTAGAALAVCRAALCTLALTLVAATSAFAQQHHYVLASATGNNTGSSWANAYTSLQNALAAAQANDVIYVGQGTYHPSNNYNAHEAFVLPSNITLYGGFAGTETIDQAAIDARDFASHPTVISGDLLGNDLPNFYNRSDNSHQLIIMDGRSGIVIDGFTITGGNSTSFGAAINAGSAICSINTTATLRNLVVTDNLGRNGALYAKDGFVELRDALFSDNNGADGYGTAIKWSDGVEANMYDVTVTGNTGGAAMYLSRFSLVLGTRLEFYNNINDASTDYENGGAIALGGGSLVLFYSRIYNNTAARGAGCYNGGGVIQMNRTTVVNNTSTVLGGGFDMNSSLGNLLESVIVWGNTAPVAPNINLQQGSWYGLEIGHSLVEGSGGSANWNIDFGTDMGNNLDADPMLVNAASGDFTLYEGSPALGTGLPKWGPNMGWYQGAGVNLVGIYVDAAATGTGTGESWANAYTSLQSALSAAQSGDKVYVAQGTYKPTTGTSAGISFIPPAGVALYGGLNGAQAPVQSVLDSRDFAANTTIISGDLQGNDAANYANRNDNTHRLFRLEGVQDVVLDGFTISGGHNNGPGYTTRAGSAIYMKNATATLRNLTIEDNIGLNGALYTKNSTVSLAACTLQQNSGDGGYGSAMKITDNSTVTVANLQVHENVAGAPCYLTSSSLQGSGFLAYNNANNLINGNGRDGGVFNLSTSSVDLEGSAFLDNTSVGSGGVCFLYGGGSTFRLVNATLSDNYSGTSGGAVHAISGTLEFINTILYANNAAYSSPEISFGSGSLTFTNSLVSGSGGSSNWNASFGTNGGGNIDLNPLYYSLQNEDIRLLMGSPAIGTGHATYGANMGWYQGTGVGYGSRVNNSGEADLAAMAPVLAEGLGVYPNPNQGRFTIALEASESNVVQLTLADATGRVALQQEVQAVAGTNEVAVDLGGLQPGLYVLYAQINQQRYMQKVLVQ